MHLYIKPSCLISVCVLSCQENCGSVFNCLPSQNAVRLRHIILYIIHEQLKINQPFTHFKGIIYILKAEYGVWQPLQSLQILLCVLYKYSVEKLHCSMNRIATDTDGLVCTIPQSQSIQITPFEHYTKDNKYFSHALQQN